MAERRQFPWESVVSPSAAPRAGAAREGEPVRCPSCGGVLAARTDEICRHCGSPLHDGGPVLPKEGERSLPGMGADEARDAWAALVMDTIQASSGYHRRTRITARVFCLLGFIALLSLAIFLYSCLSPIWL
ncbi:MAG: hypothetical protein VX346_24865 [Planctomycetota bacterium]|nr:hypothetical protein [Planctomycetota bacterium]